jgi:hypothetical protein
MKALIFLLMSTAVVAAQDGPRELIHKREQWVKHSRAQNCYRLPGGRMVCSQRQQTNPSNGQ